eukprot:CAMPEP_0113639266 /NCGR_PEP_ID=MMETSP0017_2-20120614/20594_1 /TAXON_ID=2856 /ORGANISM="Cylindrotheca closterium" /LENGTH=631 /DNA_ID=CAMNT_0000550461 /DNA_START=36 /DNA_END=1928 /DNA_ORIENTATION=- /assembly_acc=CAM_ASM_000147
MATAGDTTTSTPVKFTYTGQRLQEIPGDFTHLAVSSSVTKIGLFSSDELPEGMELVGVDHKIMSNYRQALKLSEEDSVGGCYFSSAKDVLVQVELQEGLQAIGAFAFMSCRLLRQVSVPSTVEMIGVMAFANCVSLESLPFREGLKTICLRAFGCCISLPQVILPSTVERIESSAFICCEALLEVHSPNGLKAIGEFSFLGCESLLSVSLPSTMETVGNGAFSRCKSLTNVTFQNGLRELGKACFTYCKSLLRVSLPSTVAKVAEKSFMECESLVDVELREGLQEIDQGAFLGCTSLCTVRIPASTTRIGEEAFAKCGSLLGVEFAANSRIVVEHLCFLDCSALINISLLPTMGEISYDPFWGCKSIWMEGMLDSEDLEPVLRGRYDSLPIHQLCYHSSTSRVVDLVSRMRESNTDDKNSKDVYEMTPFHILATSAKLRTDLLEVLLDEYPVDTLAKRDVNGYTMMDYLLMNKSSTAAPLIKVVLQRVIVARMERIAGLKRWKDKLSLQIESTNWSGNFETRCQCLDDLLTRLASCVKVEMTSLLELALWKRKMLSFFDADKKKRRKVDGENCRTLSGADEIMPNVIEYLWNDNTWSSEGDIDVSMIPFDVSWLKEHAYTEEGSTDGEEGS